MNTVTRGDPDKAQGMFHLGLHSVDENDGTTKEVRKVEIDIREQFFIHTFHHLLDFVKDYQKKRHPRTGVRVILV